MERIVYRPIGIIRSPYRQPGGVPIQPRDRQEVPGRVELKPEYREGLRDLSGFSHVVLVFHMHLCRGYDLEVVPFLDTVKRGLFSTRAPRRPNAIGVSVVRLRKIRGSTLYVSGLDVVDMTPLLDIKPYVPEFEASSDVRIGWLAGKSRRAGRTKADDRFTR